MPFGYFVPLGGSKKWRALLHFPQSQRDGVLQPRVDPAIAGATLGHRSKPEQHEFAVEPQAVEFELELGRIEAATKPM